VWFKTNANYSQEVIDGFNVGQPGNSVYTTLARDHSLIIADVTFGAGVPAVGFDLKSTANGSTTAGGAQTFLRRALLGHDQSRQFSNPLTTGGTTFQFAGFTSTNLITEIQFSSENLSPNLNLVLDNFLLAPQPPLPPIALAVQSGPGGIVLTWTNGDYRLQSAVEVTGPYADLPGATSPFTNSVDAAASFFRLRGN